MRHFFIASIGFVIASFTLGCGDASSLPTPYAGPPLASATIVLLSSQVVSGLGRIDVDGRMKEVPDIALGADPALSASRERFFAVVRDQHIVYEIDPLTLALRQKFVAYEDAELQTSRTLACELIVKGINPQDVAVDADGRLWVTRFEQPTVAIIEPDGSFSGTVDLSAYADADGIPEASAVHVSGDRAYVTIERLDRCGGWASTGPGVIVEIDIATRKAVKSIELGGANPFGRLVPAPWDSSGNTVAVALAGNFLSIDDGDAAAIVDLKSGTATGFGREAELDGSVVEVALAAPDEAYMIVTNPDDPLVNATSVVRIDPQTGQVSSTLLDSRTAAEPGGGYYHRGLAVLGEHLLVGLRSPRETGVVVLDRQSGQQLGVIHPAKLPPIAIQASP
jgi:hypothetical protein